MIDLNLANKVALITGCDNHEARRVAELLAEAGATIVMQYEVQENDVFDLINRINQQHERAIAVKADIRDYDQASYLMARVLECHGRVDILVNDVMYDDYATLVELTQDKWNESLYRNLYSVFNISKSVSQVMVKQQIGTIINITSSAPISGVDGSVDYSASEAAIHAITRAMARELAEKGIRVNAIAPSRKLFNTDDEVGKFALYLSSPLAQGISGEVFALNGISCKRLEE